MNAADVLAERIPFWQERNGVLGRDEARFLVDDLLAHGEQGVAILPDGTLCALSGSPSDPAAVRAWLVPVSAEAGDTDG